MAQEAMGGGRGSYQETLREVPIRDTLNIKAKEPTVPREDAESSEGKPATTGSSVTKRRRAKTPKSRTGCRTCKIRRVKCDEAKPACLRCIKFGAACDGYDFIAQETHRQPRQLLPHSSGNLTVNITPMTAIFQDQSEYQYFLHFRDEITLDLSGTIPQPMWDCVILRACNDSLPLRHLTSSIAALSKARSCARTGEGNEHHMFAARFYGRALRGIQELINTTNETDAARLTLLASLLIFCFESLQGEHASAVDHIKAAMGMMRNRFSTSRRQYSLIRKLAPIPGLENELVDIFVRIDNTLMVKVNATGDRGMLDMRYESENGYMLSAFRDLSEAKNYLEHHMFCAMPYLARLPDIFMHGAQLSSVEEEETGAQLLEQLRQWDVAFAPLFASARKSPTSQDFIAAASLRCLELVAEISVRKISAPAGTVDEFVKEATEIVHLSRRIVTDISFKKTFVFECGILPVLFITVMLCPKRSVRMDIIQVLKLAEGRVEVTWDAIEVARMAKFFMGAKGGDAEPDGERLDRGVA